MKMIKLFAAAYLMGVQSMAIAKEITIKVTNIDTNKKGNLVVMVFGKQGFPKDHAQSLAQQQQLVTQDNQSFTFEITVPEFAVKVLHDENKDGKVTKNWTGIYPKDGLGFTNKQKVGLMGPPSYEHSKVALASINETITITMVYP